MTLDLEALKALEAEYAALPTTGVQALESYVPTPAEQLADAVPALITEIERLRAENAALAAGSLEKPYRAATIYDNFPTNLPSLSARIKAALLADDVRGIGSHNSGCYGVRTDHAAPNGDVADAYFWHIDEFQIAMLVADPLTPEMCERAIALSESFESAIPEDEGQGFGIGAVAIEGHPLDGPLLKGYEFDYATGTTEWSIWRVWRGDTAAQIAAESDDDDGR